MARTQAQSFEVIRTNAISTAFSFDRHFADEGFERLP